MLYIMLKKEIKLFFSNKTNLIFMFAMPLVIVSIFSFCLQSYMDTDYGTFDDGKVFFVDQDASEKLQSQFNLLSIQITNATGVVFEQVNDYDDAMKRVELSEAFSVIRLSGDDMTYYRSPYNETVGGQIVRSLFRELTNSMIGNKTYVNRVVLENKPINSKVYYSFAGLSFVILYMALIVSNSTADERELQTIDRIRISKSGEGMMFLSKVITGILCAALMTVIVYLFTLFILGVIWGPQIGYMLLIFLALAIFSSLFGCVLGMVCKTKAMSQNVVLITNILFAFLGGVFLPASILETLPVLKNITKISPLYWTNQAMASLYNNVLDNNTGYSIAILTILSVILLSVYFFARSKKMAVSKKEEN